MVEKTIRHKKERRSSRDYKKPIFIKEKEMIFPREITDEFNSGGKYCFQCTGCHGCR